MNKSTPWLLNPLLTALALGTSSCEQFRPTPHPPPPPPNQHATQSTEKIPLLLPDSEPLLLLEDNSESTGSLADNSRCHVCHINYELEELALTHARAGLGCAECHGPSDAHIADESWASGGNGTAPDTMFPPDTINPGCFQCHPKEKISPDSHQDFLSGLGPEKVCTDCHGDHRLPVRKCRWK